MPVPTSPPPAAGPTEQSRLLASEFFARIPVGRRKRVRPHVLALVMASVGASLSDVAKAMGAPSYDAVDPNWPALVEEGVRMALTSDDELDSRAFAAKMLVGVPAQQRDDCYRHVVAVLAATYPKKSREELDVIVQTVGADMSDA
jgi:hypothetical protein